MLIYLADNRSTVINLQCVGDMHIEKSRHVMVKDKKFIIYKRE